MKLNTIKPKTDMYIGDAPGRKEKYYPRFNLSLEDFPEASKWEVGNEYTVILHVRQSDMEKRKDGKGRVGFEILAIGGEEKKPEPKNYSRLKK